MPKSYTVPPPPHHNEGKTVAGWTLNLGIVAGALIAALGVVTGGLTTLTWIGIAVIVVAIVAGIGLSLAGMGQPRGHAAAPTRTATNRVPGAAAPQPAEADAR